MAKTVIHEIVERIIVKDESSSVFSRVGGHLDALQKKSVGARLGMMALSGGLTLAVRAAQAAAVAFAATLASAGALGLYLAGRGLKQMVQEEQATLALSGALQSQGKYTDELRDKLLDLASAQQYQLGVADDAIIAADAYLISLGIQSDKIGELNTAIAALSAAMKMDFESAARLVGKSLTGMAGALGRYGIQLDASMSKEERANAIIEQTRKFLPLLAAQVDSTAGVWRVFQLAVDDGTQGLWAGHDALGAVRMILVGMIPDVRNFGTNVADQFGLAEMSSVDFFRSMRDVAIGILKSLDAVTEGIGVVTAGIIGLVGAVDMYATFMTGALNPATWSSVKAYQAWRTEVLSTRDAYGDAIGDVARFQQGISNTTDQAIASLQRLAINEKSIGSQGKERGGLAGQLDNEASAAGAAAKATDQYTAALKGLGAASLSVRRDMYSGLMPGAPSLSGGAGAAIAEQIELQQSIAYEMSLVNEQRQKQNDLMARYLELTAEVDYDYELQIDMINQLGSSVETVGQTFTDVFVGGIMGDVINARQAIESLIRSLLGGLINALIRFGAQQLVGALTTRVQTVALALEAKTVYKLTAAYWALALAKLAAGIGTGGVASLGGGAASGAGAMAGAIGAMHSGGYIDSVPRAHSGLSIGEVGPFVLQRGEFVLRKEAVRSIGQENVAQMNRTGAIGSNATFNVVINTQPGQDGADLWDEIKHAANRDMRTGGFTIPLNALEKR
jgi:hypothetical protein